MDETDDVELNDRIGGKEKFLDVQLEECAGNIDLYKVDSTQFVSTPLIESHADVPDSKSFGYRLLERPNLKHVMDCLISKTGRLHIDDMNPLYSVPSHMTRGQIDALFKTSFWKMTYRYEYDSFEWDCGYGL